MQTRSEHELALVEKARQYMPAGGLGNTSAEIILRSGQGSRVWDESGNEYIDYLIGSGPMFAGHAHPRVTAAVREQVELGSTFFANNRYAIELAKVIVDAVPCAEQVRFVCTGTEADSYAMRLARSHRGRDKILKFEGGYHGMSDTSLQSLAPKRLGNFPRPVPDSAGIPAGVGDEVLVAPYNDIDAVANLIKEHGDEIAGLIVEPVQRIIPPAPGFLEGLRELTEKHDIVLIFDEVVTGFRMAYGGAQEYYGVTPDLCTLGKACGGGYPLAAIAGREEIMSLFDAGRVGEEQFLFQIGTLSGNPIAAVAGLATLELLREPGTYERVNAMGNRMMEGVRRAASRARLHRHHPRHPRLLRGGVRARPHHRLPGDHAQRPEHLAAPERAPPGAGDPQGRDQVLPLHRPYGRGRPADVRHLVRGPRNPGRGAPPAELAGLRLGPTMHSWERGHPARAPRGDLSEDLAQLQG